MSVRCTWEQGVLVGRSVFLAKITLISTADKFLFGKHSHAHTPVCRDPGWEGPAMAPGPRLMHVLSPSGTETQIVRRKPKLEGNKRSVCNQQFLNLPCVSEYSNHYQAQGCGSGSHG